MKKKIISYVCIPKKHNLTMDSKMCGFADSKAFIVGMWELVGEVIGCISIHRGIVIIYERFIGCSDSSGARIT
jgi:hypothetical protein